MSSKEKTKIVLPKGWVVRPSSKFPDRVYYFNVYTGCSLWTPPTQSAKPKVNNTKQNDMEWKKGCVPEHSVTKKEPAETVTEQNASKQQDDKTGSCGFMNSVIKKNGVNDRKRRYEDSPSSSETSADSEKFIQKKKPLESDFQCSSIPRVSHSVNSVSHNVRTTKVAATNKKCDQQSEPLKAVSQTVSKAEHSRSDNSSIPNLKKEPTEVRLPSQCKSSSPKGDATIPPAAKINSSLNLQRRDGKFDLRHVLEGRRRTKSVQEPDDAIANGSTKEGTTNCMRYSVGDVKGVAERRMQNLRDTLAAGKEANEKIVKKPHLSTRKRTLNTDEETKTRLETCPACEVRERSVAHEQDVPGTISKNATGENEELKTPVEKKLTNSYSSSAADAEVLPPFRKRPRARRRKRNKNKNRCPDLYKNDGIEALFSEDTSGSEVDTPSKIKRAHQSTLESSTAWYPKSDCDPDSSFSSDLETSSSNGKNLGAKRLIKLRQALSNGTAQRDITDLCQNSKEYPPSVSSEESKYPGAEVHTDQVEAEPEAAYESMEWEPFEELSVSVQWTQDNNKSNTSDALVKNNEWYIVIDTNIFVSNLKVVEELRDMNDKVLGYPVLIIPTVVLTELEGIKNRSPVDKSPKGASRAAIKFINYHLRKLHPRIRAQGALNTVAVPELEIETGDDKILHCCLLLLKQTDRVILLTDDCNLRNRAKSFSIIACHHLDIQDAIQELYHCSSQPKLDALRSDGASAMLQPSQPKTAGQIEAAKVDAITCKLKSTLKELFSKFLQTEMEHAFDDMWKKLVFIKPPWSLLQVLECLRKHWIACIAFVLPSHAKQLIEKLYDFFNEKYESHGLGHTLAEVKEILQISLKLCSLLPSSKPYDDLTSLSISVIKEMLEEMKEDASLCIAATYETSSSKINNSEENKEVTVQDVQDESSNSLPPEAQGVEAVHRALDRIYLYILSFCGTMFDVLERPHDIPYTRPERLPSLTSVREAFPEVYSKLRSLLEALRGVLQTSPAVLTVDHALIRELYLSITNFFEEVQSPIAINGVFEFCAPDQREILEGALSKLVQCEGMLNVGMDHIIKLVIR